MRHEEYKRLYRNAKAKERRLKNNHNIDIDMRILTPTEFSQSRNKKREMEKLSRFNSYDNKKYQYVKLGTESVKRSEYTRLSNENRKILDRINYHKDKNLKKTLGMPFMVYNSYDGKVEYTDADVSQRISKLQSQRMENDRNRSMNQKNLKMLKRYNKSLKEREKKIKKNAYAQIQKDNYTNKVRDFSIVLKGTPYYKDYKNLMKTLKNMSADDFEKFYYLSNMGDIDNIVYISDSEVGTMAGTDKALRNMQAIKRSWEAITKLVDTDEMMKRGKG